MSRRESRRRAGARYQRTRRGARRHAARQQAWRERQIDKVTHRGCAPTGPVFTMSVTVNTAAIELNDAPSALDRPLATPRKAERSPQRVAGRCDFCHAPFSDTLSPALERLRDDVESGKWRKRLERQGAIGEIGVRFDAHLRLILGMAKLQYPGGHAFDTSTTTYNSNIGLQLPVPGGGIVCWLHHGITIMETEVSAAYGVHGGRPDTECYRGSIVDLVGLEEAMWANAGKMVAAAIDEFRRLQSR